MRDHLVGIHVGAGAGAGLKHIDRELGIVRAARDRLGSTGDAACGLGIEQPEARVGGRRGLLDQRERANERARQAITADRKVLDRALGLRAPERMRGHLQLTHAVALDPKG